MNASAHCLVQRYQFPRCQQTLLLEESHVTIMTTTRHIKHSWTVNLKDVEPNPVSYRRSSKVALGLIILAFLGLVMGLSSRLFIPNGWLASHWWSVSSIAVGLLFASGYYWVATRRNEIVFPYQSLDMAAIRVFNIPKDAPKFRPFIDALQRRIHQAIRDDFVQHGEHARHAIDLLKRRGTINLDVAELLHGRLNGMLSFTESGEPQ